MREPKKTTDGNCPNCSSSDWTLTKLVVLHGTVAIKTESNGGGFGVGAGVGNGHGGVGVNYQSTNLSTSGIHTTAMAAEWGCPRAPEEYSRKSHWINECVESSKEAAQAIEKFDEFSMNREKMIPSLYQRINFSEIAYRYEKAENHLREFQKFERRRFLWDLTRVCSRCGEGFVTEEQLALVPIPFEIPKFSFAGQGRHCPHCNDYQWKAAEIFFSIKVDQARKELKQHEEALREALAYAANPGDGGFFKRLKSKLFTLNPESAERNVDDARNKVLAIEKEFNSARTEWTDVQSQRICLKCERCYSLTETGVQ